MKPKLFIRGYFGMGNIGDEIFFITWRQYLEDRFEIVTDFSDEVKAVIVGGGDLFVNDATYYFDEIYLKKPIYIFGVGAYQKWKDNKKSISDKSITFYKKYLPKCKEIWVRDTYTYDFLKDYSIVSPNGIVRDIAWAYQQSGKIPTRRNPKGGRTIGIVPIRIGPAILDEYKIIKVLYEEIADNDQIFIFPVVNADHEYGDAPLKEEFFPSIVSLATEKGKLPPVWVPYRGSADYRWRELQSVDIMVSFKMHPTLAAMRNYVPSIVVAGANKKYELMKQVRLQHYTIGLSDDAKTIRQTIVRFLSSAPIIRNRLKERVPPIELQSRKEMLAFTNKIKRIYGKEEDPS